MGVFSQALHLPGDINESIIQTRRYGHEKYGFIVNVEQELTDGLGGFLRCSWNDGATEDWAFTQIDHSLALGLSLQGRSWHRPEDTVGLAGAVNELSSAQRRFLAAGGLGLIIGDGRLAYASEGVLETYYQISLLPGLSLSADYQFLPSPAYNTDRGPVHVFGVRLHAEY
jgi:high affinity Mn2+ porin